MLRVRVLTAIVLLSILIPSVVYPDPLFFASVAGILMTCAAWEWFKLNGAPMLLALQGAFVTAVACGVLWWVELPPQALLALWLIAGLLWLFGGGYLIRHGVGAWSDRRPWLRQVIGFVLLCAAWLAVVAARKQGINFLMSVMALVWTADIGAYFAGRKFGGRVFTKKLAPDISPGKTREGAIGGLLGVLMLALLWWTVDQGLAVDSPSLFSILVKRWGPCMLLATLLLGVMSIMGDLVESLIKRAAGVKDSSHLLPGHGGVLDRIDALLPVLPIAMLIRSLG
jgi:phosphatidate cytidylyltransferase